MSTLSMRATVPAEAPWSHIIRRDRRCASSTAKASRRSTRCSIAPRTRPSASAQDTFADAALGLCRLGTALVSNKGRVMARITADSCGQHDTSAGCCSCESNAVRFGEQTKYQHACRENFVLELSRHGLTKRDIVANLNFFMNVPIDPSGNFTVVDGISAPGNYVDITAEIDVLFVISNCPQINNPCNGFNPTPIRVEIADPPRA